MSDWNAHDTLSEGQINHTSKKNTYVPGIVVLIFFFWFAVVGVFGTNLGLVQGCAPVDDNTQHV